MPNAIALRPDFDAPALRGLARRSKDAAQARRLLSLAVIYDGGSRTEAALLGNVPLQIVRDWVARFEAGGAAQLCCRSSRAGAYHLSARGGQRERWMCGCQSICEQDTDG